MVAIPGVPPFADEYDDERVCVELTPFIFGSKPVYSAPSSYGIKGSVRSRRSVICLSK